MAYQRRGVYKVPTSEAEFKCISVTIHHQTLCDIERTLEMFGAAEKTVECDHCGAIYDALLPECPYVRYIKVDDYKTVQWHEMPKRREGSNEDMAGQILNEIFSAAERAAEDIDDGSVEPTDEELAAIEQEIG